MCALCMCMPVLSLHSAGGYLTPALGIVPACVCSLIPVYMFMSLAQCVGPALAVAIVQETPGLPDPLVLALVFDETLSSAPVVSEEMNRSEDAGSCMSGPAWPLLTTQQDHTVVGVLSPCGGFRAI